MASNHGSCQRIAFTVGVKNTHKVPCKLPEDVQYLEVKNILMVCFQACNL